MTDTQASEKIANLERRIAAGEYGKDFHLFVQNEIYPLIVEEEITLEQFTALVQEYAYQTHGDRIVFK